MREGAFEKGQEDFGWIRFFAGRNGVIHASVGGSNLKFLPHSKKLICVRSTGIYWNQNSFPFWTLARSLLKLAIAVSIKSVFVEFQVYLFINQVWSNKQVTPCWTWCFYLFSGFMHANDTTLCLAGSMRSFYFFLGKRTPRFRLQQSLVLGFLTQDGKSLSI